jgi:hypothetical protein
MHDLLAVGGSMLPAMRHGTNLARKIMLPVIGFGGLPPGQRQRILPRIHRGIPTLASKLVERIGRRFINTRTRLSWWNRRMQATLAAIGAWTCCSLEIVTLMGLDQVMQVVICE